MTSTQATRSRVPALVRALRPRQWLKNVLVFSAPVAAGSVVETRVLVPTLWAVLAFVLASCSIYLVNDVRDAEADRLHPVKRLRPIAAGEVTPTLALIVAAVTGIAALVVGFLVAPLLGATIAVYIVLQLGYTLWFKHMPIVDLAIVAAGFLLRAVAGGVASGLPISQWFLLVASFGSLFMVAGKRYSELLKVGADAGTRATLSEYTPSFLRSVWIVSIAAVIMSYSLWAFNLRPDHVTGVSWTAWSIAPFTLALLRYAMRIDAGEAGEPEDVALSDHMLQAFGLLWAASLVPALLFA